AAGHHSRPRQNPVAHSRLSCSGREKQRIRPIHVQRSAKRHTVIFYRASLFGEHLSIFASRRIVMPSVLKRALGALLFLSIAVNGVDAASSQRIVVKLNNGSPIAPVLTLLNATVLDVISDSNLYLLQAPSLPALSTLSTLGTVTLNLYGIAYIEADTTLVAPTLRTLGVLQSNAAADWYRMQPTFRLIRANQASAYYDGYGVVVADINSAVDYGHPALRGHLTSGVDFVSQQGPSYAALNQASGSFLDQSSGSFLDQSSGSFLDQSSGSFLDQASGSFLDQSSGSFLDG